MGAGLGAGEGALPGVGEVSRLDLCPGEVSGVLSGVVPGRVGRGSGRRSLTRAKSIRKRAAARKHGARRPKREER